MEDIEERVALVLDALFQQGDQVLDVVRVPAAHPGRAGGEGQPDRIDRIVDVRVREGLRLHAEFQGRRGLALRQAVHAVVMDDIQHVEVPAARVHEVAATDPEAVSVAAQAEDLELRIRELHPGRIGEGAPVQRVDSIGLHVVNRLRRASDPRDDRHAMRLHPQFREGHLNRPEDTEVAASRAPVVVDLRREVGGLQDLLKRHGSTPSSWGPFPSPRTGGPRRAPCSTSAGRCTSG